MTQQDFENEWNDKADYVVCHTSGSTGQPKEIELSKDFMRQSARRTNEFFSISRKSRLHTCLDFKYIASKMMMVRAEEADCKLTSEMPSNKPLESIGNDEDITLLSVVPSQMLWILDHAKNWKGLQNILIGGSRIPSLLRRKISLSGLNAWESYGMTETASHIALRKVTEDESLPFKTMPGITVSSDENGCLIIKMPGTSPIVTTDIAEVKSETEFLILGRSDNCIISGGIKIMPEQLENILGPFIAFDYCISSVEDSKWGERLVLVVETGTTTFSDETIAKAVLVRLNQYKKVLNLGVKSPKEIICVKNLPYTSNGKVDRKTLKKLLQYNASIS